MGELIGYMSPEEATQAAADVTDKALGAVIAMLYELYQERRILRHRLDNTDDEDEIAEYEYMLKMVGKEESSLHRIESGLQSRLSAARIV